MYRLWLVVVVVRSFLEKIWIFPNFSLRIYWVLFGMVSARNPARKCSWIVYRNGQLLQRPRDTNFDRTLVLRVWKMISWFWRIWIWNSFLKFSACPSAWSAFVLQALQIFKKTGFIDKICIFCTKLTSFLNLNIFFHFSWIL